MSNILKLIMKNLKVFFRSKISALIIILAPMLIVLLVGIAFDHMNTIGIKVGVYTPAANQYVDDFVEAMNDKEFRAIGYENTSFCIDDMKKGMVHACIDFPIDFDFELNYQKNVVFYVDYSKINLVWMIMESVSDVFASRSSEIGEELASVLLTKLSDSKERLKMRVQDVADIKNKNSQIKNQQDEVISMLRESEITYADLPLGETKTSIAEIRDSLSVDIDTTRNKINSLKSALAILDLTTQQKNETDTLISDGLESLDNAKKSLTSTSANYSMIQLGGMIEQIYQEMVSITQQISQTNSKFAESKEKITYNREEMNQVVNKLETINASISDIIDEISSIQITDAAAISNPVKVEIKHIASKRTYLNYLFPSMLVLVAMFISLLLGTTMVMTEKHGPAYFRLSVSPVKKFSSLLSIFVTIVMVVILQMIVILMLSAYFFSAQIFVIISPILIILVTGIAFFTLLGMIIGYLFKSEATGVLASISFGSILLLTSGVIIPIESVPKALKQILEYNPFIILENMIREVVQYQSPLFEFWQGFSLIGGMAVLLFLIMWIQESIVIGPRINKLMYQYAIHRKERKIVQSKIVKIVSYPVKLILGFLNRFKRKIKTTQKEKQIKKKKKTFRKRNIRNENKAMLKERVKEEERMLKEKEKELLKIMKEKDMRLENEKKKRRNNKKRKAKEEAKKKKLEEEQKRKEQKKKERENKIKNKSRKKEERKKLAEIKKRENKIKNKPKPAKVKIVKKIPQKTKEVKKKPVSDSWEDELSKIQDKLNEL